MLGENVFWDGQTLTKIDVRSEMEQPNNNTGKQEAKILEQNGEGVVYFDDRTGRVVDAGYHVWTMDYRGFGESKGDVSENRVLGDANMVYEEILKTEQIDIIWGRSFGFGIATYLASTKSPKRLVLETPYWSLPDAAGYTRPFLLSSLFRYRLPTNEYLEYVQCPVHIIHGIADEKIDFESSTRLDELCRKFHLQGKLHEISGGKHNFRPSKSKPMQTDAAFETALKESLDLKFKTSR